MSIQKPCFPFDPVERIATEISNLRFMGFSYRTIRDRVMPALTQACETSQWLSNCQPGQLYSQIYRMVRDYDRGDYDCWSDAIAHLYCGQPAGDWYETVAYPEIKSGTDLFELISFSDRKERKAYSN